MNKLYIWGSPADVKKVFDLIKFDKPNEDGQFGNFDFRKLIPIYKEVKDKVDYKELQQGSKLFNKENFSDYSFEEKMIFDCHRVKEVKVWVWSLDSKEIFYNFNDADKRDTEDTIYFRSEGTKLPEILIRILAAKFPELMFINKYSTSRIREYAVFEKGKWTEGDFFVERNYWPDETEPDYLLKAREIQTSKAEYLFSEMSFEIWDNYDDLNFPENNFNDEDKTRDNILNL